MVPSSPNRCVWHAACVSQVCGARVAGPRRGGAALLGGALPSARRVRAAREWQEQQQAQPHTCDGQTCAIQNDPARCQSGYEPAQAAALDSPAYVCVPTPLHRTWRTLRLRTRRRWPRSARQRSRGWVGCGGWWLVVGWLVVGRGGGQVVAGRVGWLAGRPGHADPDFAPPPTRPLVTRAPHPGTIAGTLHHTPSPDTSHLVYLCTFTCPSLPAPQTSG
jgi:hypothetical protein